MRKSRPQDLAPAGLKSLFVLSVPIILSQLAQIATGVVDVVMAGRLGPVELGAVSTGAAVWTPMMIFLLGLLYVLTHVAGTLMGSKRENEISLLATKGAVIGLLGGLILGTALYFCAGPLFVLTAVSKELVVGATSYARIVAFAFPGLGLFVAFRFLLEASGGAKWVTLSIVVSIALKIILNRILVFGAFGVSPLGINGFGFSTVIVFWSMAVMILTTVFLIPRFKFIRPKISALSNIAFSHLVELIRKGLPIALNFMSDYLVMAVVALFIASISPADISGHQIVFNIISVLLMLTTGVGMAGAVIVSKTLSSGNIAHVRRAAVQCLSVNVLLSLGITAVLAVFGNTVAQWYTHDADILARAGVVMDVAVILFTVDVVAITIGFILRGMGKPGIPFSIMLISHWAVSIPLGYVFAETSLFFAPLGLVGWWYGLLSGLVLATLLLSSRLVRLLSDTGDPGIAENQLSKSR